MTTKRQLLFVIGLLAFLIPHALPATKAQEILPHEGGNVAWSPDGTRLAVIASNGIFIYDERLQLLHYREQNVANVFAFGSWSPDGTKLLVGDQILDAATLRVLRETDGYLRGWLNNGTQVFGITTEAIYVRDATNGKLVNTMPLAVQLEEAVASPDGTKIASSVDNGLFIFDITQHIFTPYILSVDSIPGYVWSPDSSRIAYTTITFADDGSTETDNTFHVIEVETGQTLNSAASLAADRGLSWSENATRVAGFSRTANNSVVLDIWDVTVPELIASIPLSGSFTGNIDLSPDGTVVAVGFKPTVSNPHTLSLANGSVQLFLLDDIMGND